MYAIRNSIKQSDKQIKNELGWADFQVPLQHRHPPPPGAGQLRSQLLLGHLVRPSAAARTPPPGGGGGRGTRARQPRQPPCWPRALRAVRAWLAPWMALQRWWTAWSTARPPRQLQAMMSSVTAGCGLHLYIAN